MPIRATYNKSIPDILKIYDTNKIREYKQLFTESDAVSSYLTTKYYLYDDKNTIDSKVKNIQYFPHKKIENGYNKVKLVREWVEMLGYNNLLEKVKETTITETQSELINKDFKKIFRSTKQIDLLKSDDYTIKQFLIQVVNNACGMKLFVGRKKRDKETKKVVTNYSMDKRIPKMITTIMKTNNDNKKISRERRAFINEIKNYDLISEINNNIDIKKRQQEWDEKIKNSML